MTKRKKWIAAEIVIAAMAVIAIYGQTLAYPFMNQDDPTYILNDHAIQEITFKNIEIIFTTVVQSAWYPLARLSHAVDIYFFGIDAGRHRSVNIFFHLVNALLIFKITEYFLLSFRKPQAGSKLNSLQIGAAFAAMLFVVHPQHVEPVVWVTQRNELLAGLFFMAAIWVYLQQYGKATSFKQSMLVFFLGFLSMLSKPTSVILPVGLLLIDVLLLDKSSASSSAKLFSVIGNSIKRNSALFVLSLLISMAALAFHDATGSLLLTNEYPLLARVEYALFNYFRMIMDFFVPTALSPARDMPGFINGSWAVLGALAAVPVLLAALLLMFGCNRGYLAFLFLYIGISYLPTSGIIMFGSYSPADRWAYLPTIPFYVISAFGVVYLFERFSMIIVSMLLSIILLGGTFLANQQAKIWKSDFVLWNYVVKNYPRNGTALYYVGNMYRRTGQYEQAILYFEQALKVGPVFKKSPVYTCFFELASIYQERGDWLLASETLQRAIHYDPYNADLAMQIGEMELKAGNTDKANWFFEQAHR